MADEMPMAVLLVWPMLAPNTNHLTECYRLLYMAIRLMGEARIREYWESEVRDLEQRGKRIIAANMTIMAGFANHGQQVYFKVAYNSRQQLVEDQSLKFNIGFKLSVHLRKINGTFNIPNVIQVEVKRPDFIPNAPANVNELSVHVESWDWHGGDKYGNRKLANEMLTMSDDQICEWWWAAVRRGEYNFVIAQSKIIVNFDPRANMPRQQFQATIVTRTIKYQLVYRYTEHLILLNGYNQMPHPRINRLQKTRLD